MALGPYRRSASSSSAACPVPIGMANTSWTVPSRHAAYRRCESTLRSISRKLDGELSY